MWLNKKGFIMEHKGFTLIEVMIVIGIISVLSGVVISIINPARQRLRANQAVARANVTKACLGFKTCMVATSDNLALCDSALEIGLDNWNVGGQGGSYSWGVSLDKIDASLETALGSPAWVDDAGCIFWCDSTTAGSVVSNDLCI